MADDVVAAGYRVTVWNRDRTKAEPFVAPGATVAADLAAGARTGIVLTMLANDVAVEGVSFGNGRLLAADPGLLHVSCSSVSVDVTARLTAAHAAAGQRFVSAQVLGRPDVAAAGNLPVSVAGTHRVGDRPAMAAAVKLALNAGIPAIMQMLTEQFRIAAAHGAALDRMATPRFHICHGNRLIGSYGPIIVEQRFEPAGFQCGWLAS